MPPTILNPGDLNVGIATAHSVEVFAGNFVYGWIVALSLGRPWQQAWQRIAANETM
ncbi:MAG: hypothetical protein M0Z94_02575 [Dehalococcoidales bacterium]|nr:hypothetical protein [Dehalococcoidales bacterium]